MKVISSNSSPLTNLVLIGDSHLASSSEDAGALLTSFFQKHFPNINLINLAVGGADTKSALDILIPYNLPAQFTALILLGTNDAAAWKKVSLDQFSQNYETIISQLLQKGATKIIPITPPPVNENKLISPEWSNSVIFDYAQTVIQIAKHHQFAYLDLFAIISEVMSASDPHYSDGVHLSDAGYEIFFNYLKPFIQIPLP